MIVRRTTPPLPRPFGRRGFLTGTGATLLCAALAPVASPRTAATQGLGDYPFTLGIASGDPTADGVVLWTGLAPRPFDGGGMPPRPMAVQWEVATDERMDRIVKRGAVLATPELGHSVHVEVDGLEPSRWYWYRFKVGNELSPIGRTRTAPARGTVEELNFASPRRISTSRSISATTSTKAVRRAPSDVRICPTSRSRRSRTIGSATRSTSRIRISRRSTPPSRGS